MCDDLMREFTDFVDVIVPMNLALFKNFDPHDNTDARMDQLLSNFLANQPAYRRVWEKVTKKVLLLSHGQASDEYVSYGTGEELRSINVQLTHLQQKKDTLQEALNITEAPPALPDNEIAVQEHFKRPST